MQRKNLTFLLVVAAVLTVAMLLAACSGTEGPAGSKGPAGPTGPAGPQGGHLCRVPRRYLIDHREEGCVERVHAWNW